MSSIGSSGLRLDKTEGGIQLGEAFGSADSFLYEVKTYTDTVEMRCIWATLMLILNF